MLGLNIEDDHLLGCLALETVPSGPVKIGYVLILIFFTILEELP